MKCEIKFRGASSQTSTLRVISDAGLVRFNGIRACHKGNCGAFERLKALRFLRNLRSLTPASLFLHGTTLGQLRQGNTSPPKKSLAINCSRLSDNACDIPTRWHKIAYRRMKTWQNQRPGIQPAKISSLCRSFELQDRHGRRTKSKSQIRDSGWGERRLFIARISYARVRREIGRRKQEADHVTKR